MKSPHCVIDASPLALGHVGLGVYTARLIRLLDRAGSASRLTILATESTRRLLPNTKAEILTYPSPVRIPALLEGLENKRKAALLARRKFPNSLYISPAPMWAPIAPANTLVVMHDLIYRPFPWYEGRFGQRRLINRLCERFAKNSRHIVTVSEFSRQDIIQILEIPENKVTSIPNWIEDDFVQRGANTDLVDLRSRLQLPEEYWLYVGGYDYRKNVEFLLEAYAAAQLKTACPPLVLAGKIPNRLHRTLCDVHGTIERLSLQEDVILPGFISDDDLPGVYRAASLLIFPSRCEGFGYPPLEANACGTPVLVADNSSLREIIPSASRYCDDRDPRHLILRLVSIASGRDLPPIFSWDSFSERTAAKNWANLLTKLS